MGDDIVSMSLEELKQNAEPTKKALPPIQQPGRGMTWPEEKAEDEEVEYTVEDEAYDDLMEIHFNLAWDLLQETFEILVATAEMEYVSGVDRKALSTHGEKIHQFFAKVHREVTESDR